MIYQSVYSISFNKNFQNHNLQGIRRYADCRDIMQWHNSIAFQATEAMATRRDVVTTNNTLAPLGMTRPGIVPLPFRSPDRRSILYTTEAVPEHTEWCRMDPWHRILLYMALQHMATPTTPPTCPQCLRIEVSTFR